MPIEPFYIDEDDRPIQTFLIDPALYPVFYIDPVTDNPPPGTGGGGGAEPTYSWTLYGDRTFVYLSVSASWNTTPGDWTPGTYDIILPVGTNYLKIVGYKNIGNGCWKTSGGKYVGSMAVKTEIDYGVMGSGTLHNTEAAAAAEWAGGEVILSVGTGRKVKFGYTGTGVNGWWGEYHVYYSS